MPTNLEHAVRNDNTTKRQKFNIYHLSVNAKSINETIS